MRVSLGAEVLHTLNQLGVSLFDAWNVVCMAGTIGRGWMVVVVEDVEVWPASRSAARSRVGFVVFQRVTDACQSQ